ncbi:MAG: carbohydrate ABC transporter permease [Caldilineaceae bacterium]|nr:carbohydrate ABC transporter permease [Caldilineaceae bacterium]MXZ22613.1 carbohydrate ABC transporter permease [Caldilineaceae bacterium SB0665_bin_25]
MAQTRRLRLPPREELLYRTLLVIGILVGLIIAALPFLWMAVSSLGTAGMVIRIGFTWDMFNPLNWSLEPYVVAWKMASISKYIRTTTIYAVAVTVLATTTSSLAGYVFGRLRFPARDFLFGLVLATMMIPGSVTFLPLFILMLRLPLLGGNDIFGAGGHGLYNSYAGLILPNVVSASSIFLFRQFFRTLPKDLEDAARIDGCSEPMIWLRVIMPLSGPVVTVVALFQFQGSWNAFVWPLVMSSSERLYTISVGMYSLAYGSGSLTSMAELFQSVLLAGSVMAVLPILVLFIAFQRQFVQGIALTGLK